MEVRSSVTVRIVRIRLHIVNIAGQEHHVLHPLAENVVHNHLSLTFKPWFRQALRPNHRSQERWRCLLSKSTAEP